MIIVDAQLSPSIADWIRENYSIDAVAVKDIDLRDATDKEIFFVAKEKNGVILTKDSDFKAYLDRFGHPPKIIWLTCGNTSNERLIEILSMRLKIALDLLNSGERIVEIRDEF
ncbi:MAG: hypothetical protein C4539_00675 [Ignavibacteriales bacterium]|nr:MAG: hypothetical protein C4539_00675 [Ignavibacteriales bacterium]